MQLNDILEENSMKAIAKKTNISVENLENLVALHFDTLKKIKTLGFISILEREYNADLTLLREEALAHYSQLSEENGFSVVLPVVEEKKGRSKLLLFVVLALLGYASWYFFTQFDEKHLSELIPFADEQVTESPVVEDEAQKKEDAVAELSITNIVVSDTNIDAAVEETVEEVVLQESTQHSEAVVKEVNVSIEPISKF